MNAAVLLALTALAGPGPTAVIAGPTVGSPGDLIVLDASQSTGAAGYAWVLADSDKTFLEVEDGRKAVFATGAAGRYTFVLVAASAAVDGKPQVAIARHRVTVGDPPPDPIPPDPLPPPNPIPPDPLPSGKFGLATLARDAAAAVRLASADKQRSAAALAGSFETIASTIAAGALRTPAEIVAATREQNISALALQRTAWEPWADALRRRLNELSDNGQLKSAEDYAVAWREIAAGLKAVR